MNLKLIIDHIVQNGLTTQDIWNYFSGNWKLVLYNHFGTKVPSHIIEQYIVRLYACRNDCLLANKCTSCGCEPYGRLLANESCNLSRHSNLVDAATWDGIKTQYDLPNRLNTLLDLGLKHKIINIIKNYNP